MRKITTTLMLSTAICLSAASASAIENQYRPYIGADYAYNIARTEGYHTYHNAGSLNVGSVYNPYFGTELFYQYADRYKASSSELKSSGFQAYGLDLMAYLPLGCDGKIVPTATMGIGQYIVDNDFRNHKNQRDRGWGYRFGGGLTYNIDNNWAARILARYVKTDHLDKLDHFTEYSFGIRYTF